MSLTALTVVFPRAHQCSRYKSQRQLVRSRYPRASISLSVKLAALSSSLRFQLGQWEPHLLQPLVPLDLQLPCALPKSRTLPSHVLQLEQHFLRVLTGSPSHTQATRATSVPLRTAHSSPTAPTLHLVLSTSKISNALMKNLVVTELLSSTNAVHPSGNLALAIDGTVISTNAQGLRFSAYVQAHPLSLGIHTFTLSYPGDANYKGASASAKLKVI